MNKRNKWLLTSVMLLLLVITIFFGVKILLLINVLLGNDIIVHLNSDIKYLELLHGESQNVSFEVKVTTNPFCSALCNYKLEDLSLNLTLDRGTSELKSLTPIKRTYTLEAEKLGSGIKLYRFKAECKSIKNIICHTTEEPMSRTIIISVIYNLSEQEKINKEEIKQSLIILTENLNQIYKNELIHLNTAEKLQNLISDYLYINETLALQSRTLEASEDFDQIIKTWLKQDYSNLPNKIENLNSEISFENEEFFKNYILFSDKLERYNNLTSKLQKTKECLYNISTLKTENNTLYNQINQTIIAFNTLLQNFKNMSSLSEKEKLDENISNLYQDCITIENLLSKEAFQKYVTLYVEKNALCALNRDCTNESKIIPRDFSLQKTCNEIEQIRYQYIILNLTIRNSFNAQNYPSDSSFWNNISAKIINLKQNLTQEILPSFNVTLIPTEDYSSYDLKWALLQELINNAPNKCNLSEKELTSLSFDKIEIIELTPINETLRNETIQDPEDICCILGKCQACNRENSSSNYPIIFIHGHAIYQKSSAEFSLEAFNKIQKKLEEDKEYIDGGIITLQNTKEYPFDLLGKFNASFSFRVSYYFDVFRSPQEFIVVQTKSETLDTYAIRLKDLIDEVKYRTGKEKVNLITFSMGGLVARRYVQIFGDNDLNKMILIAAPNHGIEGDVAKYCPVIGNELECRDMKYNSLFINKLTYGKNPSVPVYTIIGTGCNMNEKQGDGIVTQESSWLDFANNSLIHGYCRSPTNPLHLDIINLNLYPQTYEILVEKLKE